MTVLDRTIGPSFQKISDYTLPEAKTMALDNGIPLHLVLSGTQPVVRLEIIFKTGSWDDTRPGLAQFTAKMLTEGTQRHTSKKIQEKIAYYGAFIEVSAGMSTSILTLYTLSKHLESLLPLLYELVALSAFPEEELKNAQNIAIQGLKVNLEKTAFIAGNTFRELLFGSSHPYGHFLTEEEISVITVASLQACYKKQFTPANCELIVAGNGDEDFHALLNTYLGQDFWGKADGLVQTKEINAIAPFQKRVVTQKKGALQSSIRMGKKLFTNAHPDYFNMYFLNEVLGGYFGSRLMQNIREDKGYTYGINSSLVNYRYEGYLVIGTDVKKEVTEQTIEEVYKEIKLLRSEPVSDNEMETVRNYMLGTFVNSISNPFAIADKFKTIRFNGLEYSFYRQYFDTIKNISAETILTTATKYLDENSISESIAGEVM
jgi:zinc protease